MKIKLPAIKLSVVFIFFTYHIIGVSSTYAQSSIALWTYDAVQGTIANPTPNSTLTSGSSTVVNIATPTATAQGLSSTTGCGSSNSGNAWQHLSFDPGSTNETNGVQYNVSTSNFSNIFVYWDQRFSNASPNTVRLQYTTDSGTTWTNFNMVLTTNTTICGGSINANGCFETDAGDKFRRIKVNLSSITGANNNPNFGVRFVASNYRATGQFRRSDSPTTVATNQGTWRFDNVNILGTPTATGATIAGSATICSGSTNISVTILGGTSPYQVIYTDGTTNTTVSSYTSGSSIAVTPGSTKTYTLVSVKSSNGAGAALTPLSGAAVITVPTFSPTITPATGGTGCAFTPITFTTDAGMDSYVWTFGSGTYSTSSTFSGASANETITVTPTLAAGTATYTASVYYTSGGCTSSTVSSATTVYALPSNPTWTSPPTGTFCIGAPAIYNTSAGNFNYTWNFYNGTSSAAPAAVLGTDYTVTYNNGTGSISNIATVIWLTTGSKSVTVNYSSQTTPNCLAATPALNTITVLTLPTVTLSPLAGQTICNPGGAFTTLTATITSSDPGALGFFDYTWKKINGSTSSVQTVSNTASTTNTFTPANAQVASTGYNVIVTYNGTTGCSVTSATTGPFVANPAGVGGLVAYSGTSICANTPPTANITLSGSNAIAPTSTSVQWQYSTVNAVTGPWSNVVGSAGTLILTPAQIGNLTATTYIRAVVTNGVCASVNSVSKTINVTPISAGTVSPNQSICSGNPSDLSTTSSTGTLQWQSSTTSPSSGFTNMSVPSATSATLLGTDIGAISTTTYYRVVATNGSCTSTSSVITITFGAGSVGGTLSGSTTLCSSSNLPTLTLSGQSGSIIKWQYSTVSDFSSNVYDITNTSTSYSVPNITVNTYYRAVIQSGSCAIAYSSIASVLLNATTWTGGGWSNAAPNSTTAAIFASGYTSTGDLQACSVQVLSGVSVRILNGHTLTVQNEVNVDASATPGTLTFDSGSSLVQVNSAGVVNSGNIIYKRDVNSLNGYDYVYWSSPVVSQSLNGLYSSPSMGYKYYWDTIVANANGASGNTSQGNWAVASGNMTRGQGYIIRGSSSYGWSGTLTSTFTGVPNNGSIPVPIARGNYQGATYTGLNGKSITNLDDNMNLIGNPYPSPVNAINFLNNNTNILGYINLWTHGSTPSSSTTNPFYNSYTYNYSNDYLTYNSAGSSTGPGTFNGYIAAGQGFFVTMVDGSQDTSQSVTFTNSIRNTPSNSNNNFFKSSQMLTSNGNNRIWLDLVDSTNKSSRTLIAYCQGATNAKDRNFDAPIKNDTSNALYSLIESDSQIIQGRALPFDDNDQVSIGYNAQTAGSYTIAIGAVDGLFQQGQSIYLEDKLLHVIYNLRLAPYVFSTAQGIFNDRFVLRYTNPSLSNSNFPEVSSSFIIFKSEDFIHIKSDISKMSEIIVYDIQGRIINDFKNLDSSEYQFAAPTEQQILVLKIITTDNFSFFRKISK
ncbi:MAG: hypothetical protein WCJ62_04580 [Flavobacterium sp.]